MRSASTGATMDENPYKPSLLPSEEPDEPDPGWWFVRRFGLTAVEWIVIVAIVTFLAYLRFSAPVTSNHHRYKSRTSKHGQDHRCIL
jgi:hypothetical protein